MSDKYSDRQIRSVLKLQELLEVPGCLTLSACEHYLDWHLSTCTAKARGITSIAEAKVSGLKDGLNIHELQFRKLSELATDA